MKDHEDLFPLHLDWQRVWRTYRGGALLDALQGRPSPADAHCPEAWMMSVVAAKNANQTAGDSGLSHLLELGGKTLRSLLEQEPVKYLGKEHVARYGATPAFLFKLIDSVERLSIQVHPDALTARAKFGSPYGKTECWHILSCRAISRQNPCIYLGFKKGITRQYWQTLFERQDIPGMLEAMHCFPVRAGDTILVKGGMPHAIGAGCLLAEIQEPTDLTLRVERTTPGGLAMADALCHQGIGFDAMFDVFHYEGAPREEVWQHCCVTPSLTVDGAGGQVRELVGYKHTPLFTLEEISVWEQLRLAAQTSFCGLFVLEGCGELQIGTHAMRLQKGDQLFIPANCKALNFCAFTDLRVLRFSGPDPFPNK